MNSIRITLVTMLTLSMPSIYVADAQIMKGVGNPEAVTGAKPDVSKRGGGGGGTSNQPSKTQQANDDKKRAAAATKAVNAAIDALVKEYLAYEKSGGTERLRDKSDYFQTNQSPDVTPEAIVAALNRPVNANPRAAAYAKWQILSGIPGRFDDKFINTVLSAYKTDPQFTPRPGVTQKDKQRLDRLASQLKQVDVEQAQQQFDEEVKKNEAANDPILKYRNELYARLPTRPETFVAGFQDAYARVNAGLSPDDVLKPLLGDIGTWSIESTVTPQQLRQMTTLIDNLLKSKKNKYYHHIQWNAGRYTVEWEARDLTWPDESVLKDTAAELQEKLDNPGGGLKFRDK